ncbi:hypothetical protein BGX31_006606, partial [Mortierella sp. GBA43]
MLSRFQSPNTKMFARTRIHQLKQRASVTKYIELFENLQAKIDDFTEAEANCWGYWRTDP